jgi:hypothetical protein
MQAAYLSGDPYLAFAKQAGLVPADATKRTHGAMRELCKQCVLGVAYGMEAKSLAQRIGKPEIVARDLLRAHRETYRKFWSWSDAVVDRAMLGFPLWTVFGWPIRVGSDPNPRSLRNFPCQANGAEMLRLAACFATDQGVEVCALIHDAMLIAAPLGQLDHDIERTKEAMVKASRVVLDGLELRTEVNVVRHPDRYQDPRGAVMWERVMKPVAKREAACGRCWSSRPPSRSGRGGSEIIPWCRGNGSYGCWKQNGSAPTVWRSSCCICTGTTTGSQSPFPAKWRRRQKSLFDQNRKPSPMDRRPRESPRVALLHTQAKQT